MFRHNMLIAYRNILRHKGSFLINLVGLSTGLACTFLIYLWVTDELKFDRFHKHGNQLYQVIEKNTENGSVIIHEGTQGPLAEAMERDLPEVISASPVMSLEKHGIKIPIRFEDKVVNTSGIFTNTDFFEIFSFPLIHGKPQNVLTNKEGIVLSEKVAVSLFGATDKAIGKNISWEIFGKKQTSKVTGVFAPLPGNNSMNFNFAASWDLMYYDLFPNLQKWWNTGPDTYLLLKNGTNITQFNSKIEKFINKYLRDNEFTISVRQYSSAYLYGNYENGIQSGGRIEYVRLFSLVALFILVIACINFMNLSTAKASRRLKEVGIKKAIGSTRKALILQFLTEALIMALLSMVTAMILVVLVLPYFNDITGKHLSIEVDPKIILLALLTTLITGILAGSYPAFYMSALEVVSVFKRNIKKSVPELLARKGLVVFQFMLSIVLIVGVMVIVKQVKYVQSKNIGYDKSNVIHFNKEGKLNDNAESFIAELKKVPGVVNASSVEQNIMQKGNGSSTYGINWPGKSPDVMIDFAIRKVDYDFIETLGMQLIKGRSFSRAYGTESQGLIFNETAIKLMGLKDPIGTKVNLWGEDKTIIGVLKDFHISSLHEPISPVVFNFEPSRTSTFMVKIAPGKERETIGSIEELYKKFNPGFLFEYRFLDELYQSQYISEQRVSVISKYFAALAIIISCLGLFGLATFNAEVRTKEIGIRKVLGASVSNVMVMLSKDFIVLIIISMLIGFPVSWIAMNAWLDGFAYRVNIGAEVYIIAAVAIIFLTLVTVSYQSLRTALMNPVNSLRSE
ncbi:MAG TPA: ABC transporter permease [Chitinophagaceae bacterium]|nr:ABC transporter permease [Chitinophagaceae bacterium]